MRLIKERLATGGEGATAREVLRHKSVEKCVMVDIDKVGCMVYAFAHCTLCYPPLHLSVRHPAWIPGGYNADP